MEVEEIIVALWNFIQAVTITQCYRRLRLDICVMNGWLKRAEDVRNQLQMKRWLTYSSRSHEEVGQHLIMSKILSCQCWMTNSNNQQHQDNFGLTYLISPLEVLHHPQKNQVSAHILKKKKNTDDYYQHCKEKCNANICWFIWNNKNYSISNGYEVYAVSVAQWPWTWFTVPADWGPCTCYGSRLFMLIVGMNTIVQKVIETWGPR